MQRSCCHSLVGPTPNCHFCTYCQPSIYCMEEIHQHTASLVVTNQLSWPASFLCCIPAVDCHICKYGMHQNICIGLMQEPHTAHFIYAAYHKKCSWQLIFCQCTLAQLARGVHVATAAACRRPVWLKCCTTIDSTPHKHHTPSVPSLSIPQRTHARRHHTAMCDYSCSCCSCCICLPCCNQNV